MLLLSPWLSSFSTCCLHHHSPLGPLSCWLGQQGLRGLWQGPWVWGAWMLGGPALSGHLRLYWAERGCPRWRPARPLGPGAGVPAWPTGPSWEHALTSLWDTACSGLHLPGELEQAVPTSLEVPSWGGERATQRGWKCSPGPALWGPKDRYLERWPLAHRPCCCYWLLRGAAPPLCFSSPS